MKNLLYTLIIGFLTLALTACPTTTPSVNNSASFNLLASNLVLAQGTTDSSVIKINRLGGFDKIVSLSTSSLPNGMSASFSPKNALNSSILNISVANNVAAKQYKINVHGQAAGKSETIQVIVIVTKAKPPVQGSLNFNTQSSTTVKQGEKLRLNIAIIKSGSFVNEQIRFSIAGLPEGVQFNFSQNPTSNSTNLLTLAVPEASQTGTFNFKLSATALGVTVTKSLSLTIKESSVTSSIRIDMPASIFTVNPNERVDIPFSVVQTGGFVGNPIELRILGLPDDIIEGLGQSSTINGLTKYELRLKIPDNAPNGSQEFRIEASSLGRTVSETLKLIVEANVEDTTRPTIISVSPSNAQRGVQSNAAIAIGFSEQMNKASVEAAFRGPIGPGNCQTLAQTNIQEATPTQEMNFTWTNNNKSVAITLKNDEYIYSNNRQPNCYKYGILSSAKDLAGNELATTLQESFSTYRTLTTKLISEKELDGYINTDGEGQVNSTEDFIDVGDYFRNATLRGFFSFDLSELPESTLEILEAEFGAYQSKTFNNPYRDLSTGGADKLIISHTYYGAQELDLSDFNRRLDNSKKRFADTNAVGWRTENVSAWVQDDFSKQDIRHSKTQYRLWFAKPTDNDGKQDVARFLSANYSNPAFQPYLEITYLAP